MGFLDRLRPPTAEEIEARLRHLTPEQRAAYDAQVARAAAASAQAREDLEHQFRDEEDGRVLEGPAGEFLYGAPLRQRVGSRLTPIADLRRDVKRSIAHTLNRSEFPEERDGAERERLTEYSRGARAEARARFRAPGAAEVRIDRLATRGSTQIDDLVAHLAACARPERVFGVYRVPDRISPGLTPHSEAGRPVEWDVVHAPWDGPAAAPPGVTSFPAGERWVARRLGEPSLLDEDLGLAFLNAAGVGPERCFGLARYGAFRAKRTNDPEKGDEPVQTFVDGVLALHADVGPEPIAQFTAARPLNVPVSPAGVVCEVLNWAEIARAVRPRKSFPPAVPSPFAYLPATPDELLVAYLEVVGVQPQDCYSAQCTVDRALALADEERFLDVGIGPRQPCADGKPRARAHGGQWVVVVYRDTADYAAGRERWTAYETEVLRAHLRRGVDVRPPLRDPFAVPRGLRTLDRVSKVVDRVIDWDSEPERPAPFRYCWPPG